MFSLVLVFAIILSINTEIFASNSDLALFEELQLKYENITIRPVNSDEEIDFENATHINSPEELELFLAEFNSISSSIANAQLEDSITLENDILSTPIQHNIYNTSAVKLSDVVNFWLGPPIMMNLQFSFRSAYDDWLGGTVFTEIIDISSWLSGLQFPVAYKWTPQNSGYTFSMYRHRVTITVTGVLGHTYFYNGLPSIVETNHTFSATYTAR
ncbi:hypothetical protein EDC18_106137 [Natranaerovirga pectinivora]|uniref:Uncharacterized protein n=1 Tax=Natranaerovirga pectinivora TaxID=682400 RepID=A0A4R3MNS7_9FIRM|nr:hypothetical protein [Natranaerovirga pectinivora]TCT14339.1 hypothetical protein EDC18_106137 [Natranaerovirga pectinivora]